MLEFFNQNIKPLNDQLGKDLGVVQINIIAIESIDTVAVRIK